MLRVVFVRHGAFRVNGDVFDVGQLGGVLCCTLRFIVYLNGVAGARTCNHLRLKELYLILKLQNVSVHSVKSGTCHTIRSMSLVLNGARDLPRFIILIEFLTRKILSQNAQHLFSFSQLQGSLL